jgi:hypothetical protein
MSRVMKNRNEEIKTRRLQEKIEGDGARTS